MSWQAFEWGATRLWTEWLLGREWRWRLLGGIVERQHARGGEEIPYLYSRLGPCDSRSTIHPANHFETKTKPQTTSGPIICTICFSRLWWIYCFVGFDLFLLTKIAKGVHRANPFSVYTSHLYLMKRTSIASPPFIVYRSRKQLPYRMATLRAHVELGRVLDSTFTR